MTFTSTPPARPGFYLHQFDEDDRPALVEVSVHTQLGLVAQFGIESPQKISEMIGLWCLLVPAEEMEKAFREGFNHRGNVFQTEDEAWLTSNARKVCNP